MTFPPDPSRGDIVQHDILHVWVEEFHRMRHESIGPFPTAVEASAFADEHIHQRSIENHGRLFEIFIIANNGEACTDTPEAYLADLEEMYGDDENREYLAEQRACDRDRVSEIWAQDQPSQVATVTSIKAHSKGAK